jgi:hypothetical protein
MISRMPFRVVNRLASILVSLSVMSSFDCPSDARFGADGPTMRVRRGTDTRTTLEIGAHNADTSRRQISTD